MYTYEDKVAAEKSNETWKALEVGHQANLDKYNKLLSVIDTAIANGEETYIGPVSGKVIPITPEIKADYKKQLGDVIADSEKQITKGKRFMRNNDTIIDEYERGLKTKEKLKEASPEITPVINVNVAPVIPQITSPCAVGGQLAGALATLGKLSGAISLAGAIAALAKKDPLAALAAAAGALGLDTFKKSADYLKQMENRVNAVRGAAIPLGPISEISAAINKANSMVQSATDCLNTAISSVTSTINAGAASVTNPAAASVSALNSARDSISGIAGSKSKSYKSVKLQIKNPVTQLPKDIQGLANKMNGVANVSQMSAGLANSMLNDVTKLTSAVSNIASGNVVGVLAGVGTLSNAKTIVNSATGKISNIGSAIKKL